MAIAQCINSNSATDAPRPYLLFRTADTFMPLLINAQHAHTIDIKLMRTVEEVYWQR